MMEQLKRPFKAIGWVVNIDNPTKAERSEMFFQSKVPRQMTVGDLIEFAHRCKKGSEEKEIHEANLKRSRFINERT